MAKKILTDFPYKAKVVVPSVYVRTSPVSGSAVTDGLLLGDIITVQDEIKGFAKLSDKEFVKLDYLERVDKVD